MPEWNRWARLPRASHPISGEPGASGQRTFAILMGRWHWAVKGHRVTHVHTFEGGGGFKCMHMRREECIGATLEGLAFWTLATGVRHCAPCLARKHKCCRCRRVRRVGPLSFYPCVHMMEAWQLSCILQCERGTMSAYLWIDPPVPVNSSGCSADAKC